MIWMFIRWSRHSVLVGDAPVKRMNFYVARLAGMLSDFVCVSVACFKAASNDSTFYCFLKCLMLIFRE